MALRRAGCVVQLGGSEKNRLVTVNAQSDDLPSRMLAAVFSTGHWLRRRRTAGGSPMSTVPVTRSFCNNL